MFGRRGYSVPTRRFPGNRSGTSQTASTSPNTDGNNNSCALFQSINPPKSRNAAETGGEGGGLRMAMKDDDDFRFRRGICVFLLEDADNVVILRTCNGQRRRCHRRPGPFPPFALTEMRKRGETFLLGKTRFCERAVLGSLFLPFSSTPTKLPLGCSSRTVPFSADQS